MNKTVIFLFIAISILLLSIISVSVAPIINNTLDKFDDWGKSNCRYYADEAKYAQDLDSKNKNEKKRNLCYRQNAMYGLEYSSFIIDLGIGFLCAQLALMHYFKMGSPFEKYTGLIGLIGGAIGFILTLVYACFSGYIFNNDAAFKAVDGSFKVISDKIKKLYPNGGEYKKDGSNKIYVYSNDKSYDSEYIKYKDLGEPQYNYNSKFFEAYYGDNDCKTTTETGTCQYYYREPYDNSDFKYLYDRWCLSLVFAVFIIVLNVCLLIFGFLLFKGDNDNSGNAQDAQEVKIDNSLLHKNIKNNNK